MKQTDQTPEPERPMAYGRRRRRAEGAMVVMVSLAPDAAGVVMHLVNKHGISRSGACHHLLRLGAGLAPLSPLDSTHGL